MPGEKKDKMWNGGTLRSRGWTPELMRELLPRPQMSVRGSHRTRVWHAEDVLQAEKTQTFQQLRQKPEVKLPKATAADLEAAAVPVEMRELTAPCAEAIRVLEEAWNAAWAGFDREDDPEYCLAFLYHTAILRRLRITGGSEGLRPGKITGYLDQFHSLSQSGVGEKLCGVLRRFVLALPWFGTHPEHTMSKRTVERYATVLSAVARRSLDELLSTSPGADTGGLFKMEPFPDQELLKHPLSYIYSVYYVPQAIRTSLGTLVALNPRDEYPEARAMKRHFILHIGGTNTGKTYAGFQRLKTCATGVYLAPLRLLALEAQELLLDAGVACSLTTGEEEDRQDGDTHVAATAEKLELSARYDVAVVDECQMIEDKERGYAWTRAILGVLAPEVHLCAAPQAKDILIRIIKSCGDTYEVQEHLRKTPLLCMNRVMDYESLQPGDALITFSKVGVLSTAEDLRKLGKEPAIIYGALPYSTRRKQVQGFLNGDMQYVVATDAIGMGLNLPIRRIIFMETRKFDGVERRDLKPEEIQQIAGRAGRYGMYDKGFVGSMENIGMIQTALETVVPPIEHAVVGFSDLVLSVDFDLLEVLEEWNRMPTVEPYLKLDVSRYITVISRLRSHGFKLTRAQELRAANIPYDETDPVLDNLFRDYLTIWLAGRDVPCPELDSDAENPKPHTLPELEEFCRKLDLYFSFSKSFETPVDKDALSALREKVADDINKILLHNLQNNIRFCGRCGAALPLHQSGRLCAPCYRKIGRYADYGKGRPRDGR